MKVKSRQYLKTQTLWDMWLRSSSIINMKLMKEEIWKRPKMAQETVQIKGNSPILKEHIQKSVLVLINHNPKSMIIPWKQEEMKALDTNNPNHT